MMVFDFPAKYVNGDSIGDLVDVLSDDIELYDNLARGSWALNRRGDRRTAFKNVFWRGYEPTSSVKEITNDVDSSTIDDIYHAVKDAVYRAWDPQKPHLIGHSSGYDSRLLSLVIKDLRVEHGEEWFGKTVFVDVLGEGSEMKEIMKRQGFDSYIPYMESVAPSVYHKESFFPFVDFYRKFNGISGFPVNMWYDAWRGMEESGTLISSNGQMFTGYAGNDLDYVAQGRRGMRSCFKSLHSGQIRGMRCWCDELIFPFFDYNVVRCAAGLKIDRSERISKSIVEKRAPHLGDIPRLSVKQFSHRGMRLLNQDLLLKAQREYNKSWYGRLRPVELQPNFYTHRECWAHYSLASLCEHLITSGYNIK